MTLEQKCNQVVISNCDFPITHSIKQVNNQMFSPKSKCPHKKYSSHHIHIISNDEITNGDVIYYEGQIYLYHDIMPDAARYKLLGNKIIGTSNTKLNNVFRLPEEFVNKYCERGGFEQAKVLYSNIDGMNVLEAVSIHDEESGKYLYSELIVEIV